VTLAPDLYWRGGKNRTARYDDLGNAIGMMQALKDDDIVADVAGAVAYLEKQPTVRADRIGITGFCMGGRVSFLAAAELPDKIKASAPFYGGGIPSTRRRSSARRCWRSSARRTPSSRSTASRR